MENATKTKCSTKMDKKAFEYGMEDASPGPAAYANRTTVGQKNRMANMPAGPAYTIGRKLTVSADTESPGPVYNLDRLTNRGRAVAPKYTLGTKRVQPDDDKGPGPAAYRPNIPKTIQPKILLPLRELTVINNSNGNLNKVFLNFFSFFFDYGNCLRTTTGRDRTHTRCRRP